MSVWSKRWDEGEKTEKKSKVSHVEEGNTVSCLRTYVHLTSLGKVLTSDSTGGGSADHAKSHGIWGADA